MTGVDVFSTKTLMALIAAGGYALATILMKLMATSVSPVLIAGVGAVLAVTVVAEVLLLREVDLGLAYIAVIATETMLVLGFAVAIGEPLTAREMAGGALVITGAAMVSF